VSVSEEAAPAAPADAPGTLARRLMRGLDRATLATVQRDGDAAAGWPYASLVLVALDHAARPLLLVSTLADHTKNLAGDPRVSLLFDGTAGLDEPLTGPRLSLLGRAARSEDAGDRARFLARHPGAALYAGFGDFAVWRVEPTRGHLVAGFGRVHWFEAADLLLDVGAGALAAAEARIVAHMNDDHADAVQHYARMLGASGADGGWSLTGVDPEGADLRRGGAVLRLPFARVVADAAGARDELVRLAGEARGRAGGQGAGRQGAGG